jgi:uncharacterized membrane protein YphA (DoxX/SURF4 family)/thiol-disulfide isomerase/thioredoxin
LPVAYDRDVDALLLSARFLLAVVFCVAAIGKLLDLEGSRRAFEEFGVPARGARLGGVALPLAELAVALALLVAPAARWGAAGALVLLLAFAGGVARAISRGRRPDCHCFGQIHSEPAGPATLIRNLVLAGMAALVVVAGPGPSLTGTLSSLHGKDIALVTLSVVVALLAAATAQLWADRHRFARDLAAATSVRVTHDPLAPPPGPHGLPPGTPAPEFALDPVRGSAGSLKDLMVPGRPTVLVFISTGCTSCLIMMPSLARWQDSLSGIVTVAAIFAGERDDIERLIEEHGLSVVLADEATTTFEPYALRGTPAGVVVGPDGLIAGPPAEGAAAIEALIRTVVPAAGPAQLVVEHA